jgi:outer membrane immunogenic protein
MTTPTLIPIAILLAALPLCGQTLPGRTAGPAPLEVTLAYSTVRADTVPGGCGCFWMEGGKAEFRVEFTRSLGFVGEIAGNHARGINSAHEDLGLVSYLFGPRFSWRVHRFTPFAQTLIGGVHGFDAIFPSPNKSTIAPEAFAMSAGGGLNIDLSHHIALRPFQADFLRPIYPTTAPTARTVCGLGQGSSSGFHHASSERVSHSTSSRECA